MATYPNPLQAGVWLMKSSGVRRPHYVGYYPSNYPDLPAVFSRLSTEGVQFHHPEHGAVDMADYTPREQDVYIPHARINGAKTHYYSMVEIVLSPATDRYFFERVQPEIEHVHPEESFVSAGHDYLKGVADRLREKHPDLAIPETGFNWLQVRAKTQETSQPQR